MAPRLARFRPGPGGMFLISFSTFCGEPGTRVTRWSCCGGSITVVATKKPQTISYPAPGARPRRHDDDPLDPHVIVLFGATGDLAKRKLIPGLAYLDQSELAPDIQIVAHIAGRPHRRRVPRTRQDGDRLVRHPQAHAPNSGPTSPRSITYVPQGAGPEALAAAVAEAENQAGTRTCGDCITCRSRRKRRAPSSPCCATPNLVERSRVVMEKPFGTDLASAVALNDFVHETFEEAQIFRIDHFLGKEAAQNILAFRFANGLFEPIWNRNFIDHIQIDIPETLGLDQRANFYESTGAYKDMVVTHLFQVMAFVVMEPPTALEPRAISEEKNKVFRSMLPIEPRMWCAASTAGTAKRKAWPRIPTPRRSSRSRSASTTGAGPAYRSICAPARRWPRASAIISIAFKEAPRTMFPAGSGVGTQGPDHLTFDLADNSKVSLSFYGKRPGPGMKLDKLSMQFSSQEIDTARRRAGGLRAAHPRCDAR